MSRVFYHNDELGKCQCITLKQLSESSNLNFDKYIKIVDRRLKTLLNLSFDDIFKDMSSEWGLDIGNLIKKLWNNSNRMNINEMYKYVASLDDGIKAVSVVLQYICAAMSGVDMFKWKIGPIIHCVEEKHIRNVISYINEMSKYTQNVAIVCYQIWVNGHYNEEGEYINDGYVDKFGRPRRRTDTPLDKDKFGHVYVTFYDTNRKVFFNYNSNLRREIKIAGFARIVEYITFDGTINHHGSKIDEMLRFWGGGRNTYIFIVMIVVVIVVVTIIISSINKNNLINSSSIKSNFTRSGSNVW